jgi:chemotaxis protein CheX
MDDADITVFITMARRYFEALDHTTPLIIEPPFIRERPSPFLDYTGIIGISGREQGAICFTATSQMLINILHALKDTRTGDDSRRDLVGEIANTLSGNAREEFGRQFIISVPVVSVRQEIGFDFPGNSRNYVIPLNWKAQLAYLLVCLK